MNFFKILRRRKQFKPQPRQLRIDGVKTTLTPTPDDAELAAQALLEHMCDVRGKREEGRCKMYDVRGKMESISHQTSAIRHQTSSITHQTSSTHDVQYYRDLSEKIRTAHEQERRAAMRYVAYCEQELSSALRHQTSALSPQTSDIAELERGLYKFQDCVEREGGELLKRWQKCLAECILLEMTNNNENENNELNELHENDEAENY